VPAFNFSTDTFSYPNELVWEYLYDSQSSHTATKKRNPPPSYALHCFVVARSARQFLLHAEFTEKSPALTEQAYRPIIRSIVSRSDYRPSPAAAKIAIPGFAGLRHFSAAHPSLLRQNCGRSWQSYLQRGNWRMILPFSRASQDAMSARLQLDLQEGRLPIVHVVTFPRLTINHALLIFRASASAAAVEFECYDPNTCDRPLMLAYDRAKKTFLFPRTHYFPGGPVNTYEIYCGWLL
jgi:hypothetical protein